MASFDKNSANSDRPESNTHLPIQGSDNTTNPLEGFLGLLNELGMVAPRSTEKLHPSPVDQLSAATSEDSRRAVEQHSVRGNTTRSPLKTAAVHPPLPVPSDAYSPASVFLNPTPDRSAAASLVSDSHNQPLLKEPTKAPIKEQTASHKPDRPIPIEISANEVSDLSPDVQNMQQHQQRPLAPTAQTTKPKEIADSADNSFKQLQELLIGSELSKQHQQSETLSQKLEHLEQQVADLSTLVGPGLERGQQQAATLTQKLVALERQIANIAALIGPGLNQGQHQVATLTQKLVALERQIAAVTTLIGPGLHQGESAVALPSATIELGSQTNASTPANSSLGQGKAEASTLTGSSLNQGKQQVATLTERLMDIERQLAALAQFLDPAYTEQYEQIEALAQQLTEIDRQLTDPQAAIARLLPAIVEVLRLKIASSKAEICQVLAPIIDEVIEGKIQLDKEAMGSALAPIISEAIVQHISEAPQDVGRSIGPEIAVAIREQIRLDRDAIASALGPEMGKAIQEQVRLERDAMVDALYPVIGNTITKYLKEAIRAINERVENAFSPEGISRKIRATVQGVSEAELILQESVPFTVKAIFLTHKTSGLVIAEAQQTGNQELESDMIAGMLTAIRSFASDCIVQPGEVSELGEIDYDKYKIVMEVAGYCYLAAVLEGEPSKQFILNLRQTLGTLIQTHSKAIKSFDGDPDTVPQAIHQLLETLRDGPANPKKRRPPLLLFIGVGLLSLIFIPFGMYVAERRIEAKARRAIAADPVLALYRLNVDAQRNTLKLAGQLPSSKLREKAERLAQNVAPNREIENNIISVELPPDPTLIAAEIKRVTAILNQMDGIRIVSQYKAGKVIVEGTVLQPDDAGKIAQAFAQIPGVGLQAVVNTIQIQQLALATRIYFDVGSVKIAPVDMEIKIIPIKRFLDRYPETHLRIVGHADLSGNAGENEQLALRRASLVRNALAMQGIDPERIEIIGTRMFPPGITPDRALWLSRCVRFEPLTPVVRGH